MRVHSATCVLDSELGLATCLSWRRHRTPTCKKSRQGQAKAIWDLGRKSSAVLGPRKLSTELRLMALRVFREHGEAQRDSRV